MRNRVRIGRGQIRERGVDYLAYALLDTVVDFYFPLLEQYGDSLEELEDEVFEDASSDATSAIYGIKRALMGLRRTIRPTQEALGQLSREEQPAHLPGDPHLPAGRLRSHAADPRPFGHVPGHGREL